MNIKDPRAKRTRKLIVDAFARLVQSKDAERITVKELVEEAGVSRATFYLHFEDIPSFLTKLTNDTLHDLLQYTINENGEAAHGDPEEDGHYKRFFDFVMENQRLFRGMLGIHGYPLFKQKFIEFGIAGYRNLLMPYREHFEDNVSLEMLTHYISYAHTGMAVHWLNEGCIYSSQYMAKQIRYLTVECLKPIAEINEKYTLPW